MMLRSLLLNGVALPLYAPEGEGGAGAEPDTELPLGDVSGNADDAGAAGGQGDGDGEGADAAGTADAEAAASAQAEKDAKDKGDAQKGRRKQRTEQKVFVDELTAQRAARRAAEDSAASKDREIENLRQLLERAGGGKETNPANTGTPSRSQYGSKEEFDRAVEQAATQREFARSTQDIFDAGIKDYEDFQESLNLMTAVGATSDEFAADLVSVDKANAHKIIHELAQTPELSKRLASMSSRQRVAELTKMSLKMQESSSKGGGKQVSRAAAPLRALEGSSGTDANDLSDNVPDDVWSDRFDKRFGLNGAQR